MNARTENALKPLIYRGFRAFEKNPDLLGEVFLGVNFGRLGLSGALVD
jgi:hypothetical protein